MPAYGVRFVVGIRLRSSLYWARKGGRKLPIYVVKYYKARTDEETDRCRVETRELLVPVHCTVAAPL